MLCFALVCEELGQMTWGVLSVMLCLSPRVLASPCVRHRIQVPCSRGRLHWPGRGTRPLCLPGQHRTWV